MKTIRLAGACFEHEYVVAGSVVEFGVYRKGIVLLLQYYDVIKCHDNENKAFTPILKISISLLEFLFTSEIVQESNGDLRLLIAEHGPKGVRT